ncbi:hypothetical protein N177_0757 [Lutibaculum baratangense AMV1]|uniref:TIGR02117 family protein n=1 Tax=Lutibaculum baratangense AMV1 TaxID=631454 RepID=V4TL42_9HYPH|nr:hypothetical protein N177_0757 [Lutibaculum baratangense AMV1]
MLKRTALAVAAGAAVALLALALGVLVPRPGSAVPASRGEGARVLLLANPIHTDIVLPATPEILGRFEFLAEDGLALDHPDLANLVFGWGARDFYINTPIWSDLRPGPAARALTVDRSVMHVSLAGPIGEDGPDLRCLDLGEAELDRLLAAIEARFSRGAGGRPRLIAGAGYTPYDRFYEAEGWFNLLVGCNTFTAGALRAAGITTGLWTPLPATLFLSLDLHEPATC